LESTLASLFASADKGDRAANQQLFRTLYAELHRMAKTELRRHSAADSLRATSLLHETYIDLASRNPAFPDRARFFAYAGRAMRGLIIDYLRERHALKRGGEFHLTTLNTDIAESVPQSDEMTRLDDALTQLAQTDGALAELVDLKFFCGFSFADIAAMRAVSERTVQRDWKKARIFLHNVLQED
jgi:RNA polymerase sigma factor (TIGR02999 family)